MSDLKHDLESRFIAALLSAKPGEQATFHAQQIPPGVFKLRPTEMHWINAYRDKHGVYPSVRLYESKFDELELHSDPLSACLQPIMDLAMFQQMVKVQEKTRSMLDDGQSVQQAMTVFKTEASQLSTYSADYVDVDFNRSRSALVRYQEWFKVRKQRQSMTTPWPTLTKLIKFLRPGELVTICGRTSLGKTWLVINWCHHIAKGGTKCVFFTKEMPTEQIHDRFEALHYRLPYDAMRASDLPPKVLRRWRQERQIDSKMPLVISGEETLDGGGLAPVIALIQRYQPEVAFIDGAYLIRPEHAPKNAQSTEVLRLLSNRLKTVAKVTKTVIVPVIQMNRQAESKDGSSKGSITSVYGSDAWAQDSDYVIDIGGKRGTSARLITLLKGRESNIGDFMVNFQLDPQPDFSESALALPGGASGGKVSFKGVS